MLFRSLPKAAPTTTLGASTLRDDTSIEDDSSQSQLVTMDRLKEVIKRIDINNIGLKAKIKDIRLRCSRLNDLTGQGIS